MRTLGQSIATLFGRRRSQDATPAFPSPSPAPTDAEADLTRQRDEALGALERAAVVSGAFSPDYSVESLRALDAWYHDLWQRDAFVDVGAARKEFERWMAYYYGAVAVRNNPDVRWVVEPRTDGSGRFDLGVRRGDSPTVAIDVFRDHYKTFMLNLQRPRQSIYRQYRDEWK